MAFNQLANVSKLKEHALSFQVEKLEMRDATDPREGYGMAQGYTVDHSVKPPPPAYSEAIANDNYAGSSGNGTGGEAMGVTPVNPFTQQQYAGGARPTNPFAK